MLGSELWIRMPCVSCSDPPRGLAGVNWDAPSLRALFDRRKAGG